MGNSVKHSDHRRAFKDVSVSVLLAAGTDPDRAPLIAGKVKYSVFITRIMFTVTTVAAQAITFRTSEGTPRVLAILAASAPLGGHVLVENEEGIDLGDGNSLNVDGAAGVAGSYIVEGFMRPTAGGVMTPAQV
jgi:hypothetical protein